MPWPKARYDNCAYHPNDRRLRQACQAVIHIIIRERDPLPRRRELVVWSLGCYFLKLLNADYGVEAEGSLDVARLVPPTRVGEDGAEDDGAGEEFECRYWETLRGAGNNADCEPEDLDQGNGLDEDACFPLFLHVFFRDLGTSTRFAFGKDRKWPTEGREAVAVRSPECEAAHL